MTFDEFREQNPHLSYAEAIHQFQTKLREQDEERERMDAKFEEVEKYSRELDALFERADAAVHRQPTDKEFIRDLEETLVKIRHPPEVLPKFLAAAEKLYHYELFHYAPARGGGDDTVARYEYVLRMATKGPRLAKDCLVRLFTAYNSQDDKQTRTKNFLDILNDPIYVEHGIFRAIRNDINRTGFKGSYFGTLTFDEKLPEPIVSPELAFSGTWVLAAQGYGKTTLLSKLILDRMKEPCSIIIFDSKPELSTFFRDRKFPKDVVIIDPDPFLALNPLDLGTHNVDILMYLFAALLDAKFTPLQSVALRQAVYLTSLIPNATFATFTDIINNGAKRYPDVVAALDDEERTFWERDYDSGTYRDTRAQIIWRLNLLRPPGSRTRTMFNAPKTKVRLPPLMDGNTITIINNSIPELGGLQSEFFSRLFLVLILGAAEQRALLPENKKRPCYIFMDEAHTVIANEPNISDIIYRTRSQKIALLCAHQSLSQIKNEQVTSALSDCAIRYANCDNDAPSMATHLGTTADHLRGLGVGQFALAVRGTPGAQTIKVPLPDFSPYPKLSAADIEARQARFREQYCYTPVPKPDVSMETAPTVPSAGEWGGKPVL